ncbi:MAG: hypothetical protein DRG83_09000 [Deltaproteobacteria bacterium]|nr:MAG: hypothetical protein DRG83_09000 [Deltaproteobacteria bacterium]
MKRKNFIIGIALLLTVALFASPAMAWGPGCGRGMRYALLSNVPTIPNLTPENSDDKGGVSERDHPLSAAASCEKVRITQPLALTES